MLARPPFAPILFGFAAMVLAVMLVISPLTGGWSIYFPEPLASYLRLQSAEGAILDIPCRYSHTLDWQTLAQSPDASQWFHTLAREAATPAARAYAFAGLRLSGVAPFDSAWSLTQPEERNRFFGVYGYETGGIGLTLNDIQPRLRSGGLSLQLSDTTLPYCD